MTLQKMCLQVSNVMKADHLLLAMFENTTVC